MSLILTKRDDNSRYKVNVVTPDDKSVNSLTNPISKTARNLRVTISRMISIMMITLFGGVGILSSIGAASPAQAGWFEDSLKGAVCATGMYNYGLNARFLGPTTGDQNSNTVTPYEKYGTAGLTWTVWVGPEQQEHLDDGDKAKWAGKQIRDFAGGEGKGIGYWGDNVKTEDDVATQYPGLYNVNQTCVPVMDVGTTFMGNFLLQGSAEVIHITNLVYQIAYETSSNILFNISPVVEKIVESLKDAIYLEFLTPVIMIAALWMAWVGLVKKQSTQMAQGAIWMIGAMVASLALMTNPMWLPEKVNLVVATVSEASMDAITKATADENGDSMCSVTTKVAPLDDQSTTVNEATDPDTRNSIRRTQCTLWYSFLYTPWVIGEFGESPAEVDDSSVLRNGWTAAKDGDGPNGNRLLAPVNNVTFGKVAAPESSQNWALYHLDNKVRFDGETQEQHFVKQRALLNVANSQLHMDDYNTHYKGEDSMNRVMTAGLGLLAALGAAIMIVIISMSIIVLDIGLIIMTLVSPLFFLIGVHPGAGRRIALGWVETIIGLALKRIVLSVFLAVMLVFYTAVLNEGSNIPWLLSMIMVVAVSIGGITYKDQVVNMVNKVSLGGNGGLSQQSLPGQGEAKSQMKRHTRNAALHAMGATTNARGAKKITDAINNRNDGAGGRKNGVTAAATKKSIQAQAAQDVLNGNSGAGARKNSSGPVGDNESASAPEVAGATDGAGARKNDAGLDDSATDSNGSTAVGGVGVVGAAGAVPAGIDARSNGSDSFDGESPVNDNSGAGARPQHLMGPNGTVVDASGRRVPESELSSEERSALAVISGAGERPHEPQTAAERLRASNPAVIEREAQARAARDASANQLLPPMPIPVNAQKQALRENKRIESEKTRLQKKANAGASASRSMPTLISRSDAINSLKQKDEATQQARAKRTESISRIKREVVKEPIKELRDGARGADKMIGSPVQRSVGKVNTTAKATTSAIDNRANQRWQQRQNQKQFENDVVVRTKEIRQENRSQERQLKEALRSIPKPHQAAFVEKWNREHRNK